MVCAQSSEILGLCEINQLYTPTDQVWPSPCWPQGERALT